MNDVEALKRDWEATYPLATGFAEELEQQFTRLLSDEKIAVAVPVQKRVKTWGSLEEKLGRKGLELTSVTELHDLVGLRIILLFRRDVDRVCELLNQNLRVLEQYDTSERLSEDQFGYASTHLIVTLPDAWLQVPTFARLKGLKAEVQVRTAAQHAWAAASHVLQYKAEASIPASVRRSINRVSALLETVDLEFERVLAERSEYRAAALESDVPQELNVDLLEAILDAELPQANKVAREDYDAVVTSLATLGVTDSGMLRKMLDRHKVELLSLDQSLAQKMAHEPALGAVERERAMQGIWLSHTGLVRELMKLEFGEQWMSAREGTRKLISTRLKA